MSQLIHLKQRIKAISSIKKITQTMRLISMSSHSKLKKQSESLKLFKNEVKRILCALKESNPEEIKHNSVKNKTLFIIFASEKGLCGSFNSTMFNYFNRHLTKEVINHNDIICVGKKALGYLQQKNIVPIAEFDKVLPNKLETIAQNLYEKISLIYKDYDSVICLSSYPKTFFAQEAQSTILIPIQPDPCDLDAKIDLHEYIWVQDQESVRQCMFQIVLKTNIVLVLTNSMLAEQSARFLSMDNATRSAETLLKSMKLAFNKLRQAKITSELIELISGF